ncbi:MAG: RNA 2'-phosphotransferase [Gammaproteobacteria bacterium]|nr:RNA 2'-phosphotransferase [Gammaproteobacteria bacterium]
MKNNITQLSKTSSYVLRHAPWEYELELDDEGWIPIEEFLSALQNESSEWVDLSEDKLHEMISQSSKQRHEIKNGKIRALYGHSTPNKLIKKVAEPPEVLYHGTSFELAPLILQNGLLPMKRHYVHLSLDVETARQVGLRKSKHVQILKILAKKAFENGILFYVGNEHVWLADRVPSEYMAVI